MASSLVASGPDAPVKPKPVWSRRAVLRGMAASALASVTTIGTALARADDEASGFPRRPITLIVPWAAGGATDLTIRQMAELAGQQLGQRIVVENRGGAGGTLAMPVLQQAALDGYTLAQMPQTVFRAPWIQKVAWDPIRDTTPILQLSGVTFGMVVPASSALTSVDAVLNWARRHPGELTLATNGIGTTPHVVLDEWFEKLRLSFVHIPYKGVAEQMLAVASGQVMLGIGANGFAPYVDSGRVRLLSTMAARPSPRWPGVPTLKELGHGIVANSPYGLAGPKGMPAAVVRVLHEAFRQALHDPRHLAELAKYDQETAYLGPTEYGRSMQAAYALEQRVVARMGLASRSGS